MPKNISETEHQLMLAQKEANEMHQFAMSVIDSSGMGKKIVRNILDNGRDLFDFIVHIPPEEVCTLEWADGKTQKLTPFMIIRDLVLPFPMQYIPSLYQLARIKTSTVGREFQCTFGEAPLPEKVNETIIYKLQGTCVLENLDQYSEVLSWRWLQRLLRTHQGAVVALDD